MGVEFEHSQFAEVSSNIRDVHTGSIQAGSKMSRRNIRGAQDDRQLAWLVDKLGVVHDVGAPKRDPEKEPQCRDALVEGRNAGPTCRQMKLIAAYVFEARGIGRAAEEGGEVLDPLHSSHVGSSALTCGSSCLRSCAAAAGSGHRWTPMIDADSGTMELAGTNCELNRVRSWTYQP